MVGMPDGMARLRRAARLGVVLSCSTLAAISARAQSRQAVTGITPAGSVVEADASGEDIYQAACVTCHGADGRGTPRTSVGFDTPLPDFTDCPFATAEADVDWMAVVHKGGRVRGLSRRMPAFGDALTLNQIAAVVGYIRRFCVDKTWPRGDLNFPRAFFTEKAFPENEAVLTNTASTHRDFVGNELVYERRLGTRNQLEAVIPVDLTRSGEGWQMGLGDVAFAVRRTVLASLATGTVAAVGGEVAFPTGNPEHGLGAGYHVFEPFAMFGQALPRGSFVQFHAGLEIPSDSRKGATEAYARTAIGVTRLADRGFGRSWSPQVELLWKRPAGSESEWDVVPQLQISLSKIQHVMLAVGVRAPLHPAGDRGNAVLSYVLWDWFDGPFTKYWK